MSDVTPDDGERIFRLIYRSHSLVASEQRVGGLGEIFATARRRNRELGITGALVVTEDAFVQTLEGDEDAVRRLFETICQDEPRPDHPAGGAHGPADLRPVVVGARLGGRRTGHPPALQRRPA
jgi:FAD-dependent sensor of blue light